MNMVAEAQRSRAPIQGLADKDLYALGLKLVMLTEDNRRTADAVARQQNQKLIKR